MEPSIYWWHIQDAIAGFARVATYDRAGFGWSPRSHKPQSMEDRAADLASTADASDASDASDARPNLGGFACVNEPGDGGIYPDASTDRRCSASYLAYVRKSMRPMLGMFQFLSRIGVMRLFGLLSHSKGLSRKLGAHSAPRAGEPVRPGARGVRSILNAPPALRVAYGDGHLQPACFCRDARHQVSPALGCAGTGMG
jgi:hypothetical protein